MYRGRFCFSVSGSVFWFSKVRKCWKRARLTNWNDYNWTEYDNKKSKKKSKPTEGQNQITWVNYLDYSFFDWKSREVWQLNGSGSLDEIRLCLFEWNWFWTWWTVLWRSNGVPTFVTDLRPFPPLTNLSICRHKLWPWRWLWNMNSIGEFAGYISNDVFVDSVRFFLKSSK